MAISSMQAAKKICEKSNWAFTNMQVQKVLYISHMAYMGENEGQPLIPESFEAWCYGPVEPTAYHKLKIFGDSPVKNIFRNYALSDETNEARILDKYVDELRSYTLGRLVAITHWEEGAWSKHYQPGSKGRKIPISDIFAEYQKRSQRK